MEEEKVKVVTQLQLCKVDALERDAQTRGEEQ